MALVSPPGGGDDIFPDILSVTQGSFSPLFAYLCTPHLPPRCFSASAPGGGLPLIAGWLTRAGEVPRSYYFCGDDVSVYMHLDVYVHSHLSIYLPTGLFLPQTGNSTGIMSFCWDPHSS